LQPAKCNIYHAAAAPLFACAPLCACLATLPFSRHAPQTDYSGRKYGGGKLPYQRVFFEFSDEPLSQPLPGGGGGGDGGGGGADLAQLAFLQVWGCGCHPSMSRAWDACCSVVPDDGLCKMQETCWHMQETCWHMQVVPAAPTALCHPPDHLPARLFDPSVQGQLRDKDRRLQTMATQLVESEDKAAQLQADLSLARSGCAGCCAVLGCAVLCSRFGPT